MTPTQGKEYQELRHKLRMIISHASGGALSKSTDLDRSVNDICVDISRHHNRVWEHAREGWSSNPKWIAKSNEGFIPREYKVVWLYSEIEGPRLYTRGMGHDEWYNSAGERPWAYTHWMPFTPPNPPEK